MDSSIKLKQLQDDDTCVWCGQLYSDHKDSQDFVSLVPRMPCSGLKIGFLSKAKQVMRVE